MEPSWNADIFVKNWKNRYLLNTYGKTDISIKKNRNVDIHINMHFC